MATWPGCLMEIEDGAKLWLLVLSKTSIYKLIYSLGAILIGAGTTELAMVSTSNVCVCVYNLMYCTERGLDCKIPRHKQLLWMHLTCPCRCARSVVWVLLQLTDNCPNNGINVADQSPADSAHICIHIQRPHLSGPDITRTVLWEDNVTDVHKTHQEELEEGEAAVLLNAQIWNWYWSTLLALAKMANKWISKMLENSLKGSQEVSLVCFTF